MHVYKVCVCVCVCLVAKLSLLSRGFCTIVLHISEVLSAFETLQQWKLEENRLVVMTTDSGSNIKAACEILGWAYLSCFGHNLNLAVSKGLNDYHIERA